MEILFTICARAGSKGVKNKNIIEFCGKPLVYHTLEAYKKFIEKYGLERGNITLAVNTDSRELVEQISQHGEVFTFIKRKQGLEGDRVSKIDVIKDTVVEMEKLEKKKYDIIIDLDLTSPLRTEDDIKGVLDELFANSWADVSFSVVESRRSPYFNMVEKKEDGSYGLIIESKFIARQQAPKCYDMNASIYVYRREFLIGKSPVTPLSGKAVIYEMRDTGVLDIDSEEDYRLLEKIAREEGGDEPTN